MLALENVGKTYGGQVALAPTGLTAARGQIVVVVGPSGCGKSTLLRLILGLVEADAGRITVDGAKKSFPTRTTTRPCSPSSTGGASP